ncbi:hypothetical protein [Allocoleopsis franciscana]|uniref:Uncharacterized protein n=1 Tax=Allocoleopsis franciscana PCC 7113 TaxID=1173027 RepID=K9WQA7_9CYAN|nr:hypothetical protein [Allocoleopsis franciscana]AFZ22363.1 hypothetical protein Mic7113_6806 [Allocoleopsis franciscana PCC 7113]
MAEVEFNSGDCPPLPDTLVMSVLAWEKGKINHSFVFDQIRKYNQTRRQLYRDKALLAVGIHVGLLKKSNAIAPELSNEERQRVLYFLLQFLKSEGCNVKLG